MREGENITVYYLVLCQSAHCVFYLLQYICSAFDGYYAPGRLLPTIIQVALSALTFRRILSIHSKITATVPALSSKMTSHLVHLLRFFQLGSTAIAGFIYCFLTFWHNNHYCTFYPSLCTASQMKDINVPWPLIVMITTVAPS